MILPWNRREISEIWKWPQIGWVNMFGWWAEEVSSKLLRKWLSFCRTLTLSYFSAFSVTVVVAIISQFVTGDINNNMFTIFASSPGLVGMGKMYCIVIYRKPLKAAMNYIDGNL